MNLIIDKIKESVKQIYIKMNENHSNYIFKCTDNYNKSGDKQKPLDLISNDIIKHNLSMIKCISGLVSEEDDEYLE